MYDLNCEHNILKDEALRQVNSHNMYGSGCGHHHSGCIDNHWVCPIDQMDTVDLDDRSDTKSTHKPTANIENTKL